MATNPPTKDDDEPGDIGLGIIMIIFVIAFGGILGFLILRISGAI